MQNSDATAAHRNGPALKHHRRWRRLWRAAFALVAFFIPCTAVIAFELFVSDSEFLPSNRLVAFYPYALGLAATLYAGVFGSALIPRMSALVRDRQWRSLFRVGVLLVFSPFFGAGIWLLFISGPVSYGFHVSASPIEATSLEEVTYADIGSRFCINQAQLFSHSFLTRRRVCNLSRDAVEALRRGGKIEFRGLQSPYGMSIQSYKYWSEPR